MVKQRAWGSQLLQQDKFDYHPIHNCTLSPNGSIGKMLANIAYRGILKSVGYPETGRVDEMSVNMDSLEDASAWYSD